MSGIETIGMEALQRRVRRWPTAVAQAAATLVHSEVHEMAVDMRTGAPRFGGPSEIASASVQVVNAKDSATVSAGGGGLAGELLMGAEFGGQRAPKRAYVTRSRKGTPYIVRRRTTRQFHPHLGRRGYWYWPTVRQDMRGIYSRMRSALVKAMGG